MSGDLLINKLVIRSFKSIVEQEILLGRVNVFVGANGSGKSNVIEAIGVLSAAASGRVDDESLKYRGVRPGLPRLYKSAFGQRMSPHIFFEADADEASYAVSLNNPLEKPRPTWSFKTEDLKSGGLRIARRGIKTVKNPDQGLAALKVVELEKSDPAVGLINVLRDYAIYTPNTLMLRGLIADAQTRDPVGLSGGRLGGAVRELKTLANDNNFIDEAVDEIREMIDWVEDFDTTSMADTILSSSVSRPKQVLRFRDRYMRAGKNVLTAHDASEGALYVLFSAALALLPNTPKLYAIDNIDQALNPRLTQRLIRALCKWIIDNPSPRQLLFTAHNPAVLDGLPLLDDRVRLFVVDRNSEGHTIINRIEITEERRKLHEENGWPLSRLWVMGHLGGVPNV